MGLDLAGYNCPFWMGWAHCMHAHHGEPCSSGYGVSATCACAPEVLAAWLGWSRIQVLVWCGGRFQGCPCKLGSTTRTSTPTSTACLDTHGKAPKRGKQCNVCKCSPQSSALTSGRAFQLPSVDEARLFPRWRSCDLGYFFHHASRSPRQAGNSGLLLHDSPSPCASAHRE